MSAVPPAGHVYDGIKMGLPGVLESPTSALQVRRSPSELQEHVMGQCNRA